MSLSDLPAVTLTPGPASPATDGVAYGGHDPHDEQHEHGHGGPNASSWLLKAVLLLALSGYFVYLWRSGNLGNYINARFVWLSVVAAGLFLILGVASLYLALKARSGRGLTYGYHDVAGHTHPGLRWPVAAILAVPLVLGFVVPSQPLGAGAVSGELIPTAPSERMLVASSSSTEWTVVDWLRVFYYTGNPDRLTGREADVTGFVYRRPGDPSGHFMVARFMMSCCSADSYALGVPVAWEGADALPLDTWVRVQGPVRVGPFGKNAMPIIEARSVDASIGTPAQPYLYP